MLKDKGENWRDKDIFINFKSLLTLFNRQYKMDYFIFAELTLKSFWLQKSYASIFSNLMTDRYL